MVGVLALFGIWCFGAVWLLEAFWGGQDTSVGACGKVF